jgi:hypothetical protein
MAGRTLGGKSEAGLASGRCAEGPHDVQRERDEPVVIGVGQFTLGLRPDELV